MESLNSGARASGRMRAPERNPFRPASPPVSGASGGMREAGKLLEPFSLPSPPVSRRRRGHNIAPRRDYKVARRSSNDRSWEDSDSSGEDIYKSEIRRIRSGREFSEAQEDRDKVKATAAEHAAYARWIKMHGKVEHGSTPREQQLQQDNQLPPHLLQQQRRMHQQRQQMLQQQQRRMHQQRQQMLQQQQQQQDWQYQQWLLRQQEIEQRKLQQQMPPQQDNQLPPHLQQQHQRIHQQRQLQQLQQLQQQLLQERQRQQKLEASGSKLERIPLRPHRASKACRDPWAFDRTISRDETATEAQKTAGMLRIALGSRRERIGGRAADDVRLSGMKQRQGAGSLQSLVDSLDKINLDVRLDAVGPINELISPDSAAQYSYSSDDSQEVIMVLDHANRGNPTMPPHSERRSKSRPARKTLLHQTARAETMPDGRRAPPRFTTEWDPGLKVLDPKAAAREATMIASRYPARVRETHRTRQEPFW